MKPILFFENPRLLQNFDKKINYNQFIHLNFYYPSFGFFSGIIREEPVDYKP